MLTSFGQPTIRLDVTDGHVKGRKFTEKNIEKEKSRRNSAGLPCETIASNESFSSRSEYSFMEKFDLL